MNQTILRDLNIRNRLVDQVDILNTIGKLELLPVFNIATINRVAKYFDVESEKIYSLMKRHFHEFVNDGLKEIDKSSFIEIMQQRNLKLEEDDLITKCSVIFLLNRKIILKIAMLLRDNELAYSIRVKLLKRGLMMNMESKSELSNNSISYEQLGEAFLKNDIAQFANALKNISYNSNDFPKDIIANLRKENMALNMKIIELTHKLETKEKELKKMKCEAAFDAMVVQWKAW